MDAIVKIGTSAWTERTLVESGWYPAGARSAEAKLRYYASQFPIVEVDSPYYALPTRHQAEVWSERTPAGFTMNLKAYALLTEHYTEPSRLPRDLRDELPPSLRAKRKLYPKDVDRSFLDEVARRFRDAIEPLHQRGKLGVILFQYPVWFSYSKASLDHLASIHARVPAYRIAVEFRNRTWLSARNRLATLRFLADHDLTYTCVDEPQGFPSSVPPIAAVTSPLALVRFHGRNARTWDRQMAAAADRFAYRYTAAELAAWLPSLRRLTQSAREVHVIMNNCHRDYAVDNAAQLATLLAAHHIGEVVSPQPPLQLESAPPG
jgi:uncharacterized protein YecE (DUF72 family)